MRQPYLIYKKTVRDKKHYYVKLWDERTYDYSVRKSIRAIKDELGPKGSRFPHTSKAGADALVQLWLKEKPIQASDDSLISYLLQFWTEESDYIKGKQLRGQSISKEYLGINHAAIEKRFKAFLETTRKIDLPLVKVTPDLLESFINYLSDLTPTLSNRRINQIVQAVKVPLSDAFRLGKLSADPGKPVQKLPESKPTRDVLSPAEVKAFFAVDQEDPRYSVINLLAATTGLRLGECRGLQVDDIKEGYIEVRNNWQDKEGLKPPKWGSARAVPLPGKTADALAALVKINPYGGPFVFWGNDQSSPLGKWHIDTNFKNTFCQIEGMTEQIRKDRRITFHAWRHFYNTMLRGEIPDHALRKLTGHSSEAMTERYTAVTEDQRKAVSELADKIV